MKYPCQLLAGAKNTVIALSDREIAKLYTGDIRSDLDGLAFDNILLTEQRIRLIDVGISALRA